MPLFRLTKKISLRFSILSIFLALLLTVTLLILSISIYTAEKSMLTFSKRLMTETADTISSKVSSMLDPAEFSSEFSAQLIVSGELNPDDIDALRNYTFTLLKSLPQAAKVYWGDESGRFVIARYENEDTISTEVVLPDEGKSIFKVHDIDGTVKSVKDITPITYDPRVRPWYVNAKNEGKPTWSDVYIFFTGKYPFGVTSSAPVFENGKLRGVFGVDIGITQISHFLEQMPISKNASLFITNEKGLLVATPGIEKYMNHKKELVPVENLSSPAALHAYQSSKKFDERLFKFSHESTNYLAHFQHLQEFKQYNWLIGIILPEDYFIGEIQIGYYYSLLICILTLILGIYFVSYFSEKVSNPLRRIVSELRAVEEFELTETPPIESNIKEIHYMGTAISSMKRGLRAFQKFVPDTLVRKLIKTGEGANLGGKKKMIAIMFADVEKFTKIAEKMDPQELSMQLCEYFDALHKAITVSLGTTDKYIGDSVMAFWGAPVDDDQCVHHACHGVLLCVAFLEDLEKKWKSEGKPFFYTRFGLHFGEALVGNIGSSERINYTAIGDATNEASRLESINKLYNTQIVVSDSVYHKTKDTFQFRFLDNVHLRGKKIASHIYELVSHTKDPEVEEYNKIFCQGFALYQDRQWDEAIKYFEECDKRWPGAGSAKTLLVRCNDFKQNPPDENWDGVWYQG